MLIRCPTCASGYDLDPEMLPVGRILRCAHCRDAWAHGSPDPVGANRRQRPAEALLGGRDPLAHLAEPQIELLDAAAVDGRKRADNAVATGLYDQFHTRDEKHRRGDQRQCEARRQGIWQAHGANSARIAALSAPIAGTGPSARGPSLVIAGGAAIAIGPDGVCTVTRRSAGWAANSASPLTKP